ncbi:MAG: GAF domain-containing protein [Acidobacteriota bacterium]
MKERLNEILKQFAADCGTVHLMGSDGQLYLVAAIGIPDPVLDLVGVVPVGKGMAGLAAERREPVSVCNLQTDSSGDAKPGAKAAGMEGSIALPILVGDRLAGVLGLGSRGERTFTEDETARMMAAGVALLAEPQEPVF